MEVHDPPILSRRRFRKRVCDVKRYALSDSSVRSLFALPAPPNAMPVVYAYALCALGSGKRGQCVHRKHQEESHLGRKRYALTGSRLQPPCSFQSIWGTRHAWDCIECPVISQANTLSVTGKDTDAVSCRRPNQSLQPDTKKNKKPRAPLYLVFCIHCNMRVVCSSEYHEARESCACPASSQAGAQERAKENAKREQRPAFGIPGPRTAVGR